jgi:pilus assembly protein CpaD
MPQNGEFLMSYPHNQRTSGRGKFFLVVAGAACLALSACANNNRVVTSNKVVDYHDVHPITLIEGERTIDIFAAGGGGTIGMRQIADIRAFAIEYRRSGNGPLYMAVPRGNKLAVKSIASIREALQAGGISPVHASYQTAGGPGSIAPVKLTFARLEAKVASRCGLWPSDLNGNGGTLDGWTNNHWENYGCATQTMIAAQVADPLDLVRGRPETPGDPMRRVNVLMLYRQGQPTAVQYPDAAAKINTGVGN